MNQAIVIDNLTRVFGSSKALDQVSFKVGKGEVHGFLGPNGAGKSTTMKIISGILAPTSGEVWVDGIPLSNLMEIKKKIGILPETPPLYEDLTVTEYLEFALKLRGFKEFKKPVGETLEKTGLTHVAKRLIGNLSRGYKQRVGVAQAIVFNPEIIILDEPTVGLDPSSILEMRDLIKNLAKAHTVILSSHLLHEISLACSHLTIINHGKILATGTLKDLEQKFHGKKIITAKLLSLSAEQEKLLTGLDYVASFEVQRKDSVEIRFVMKSSDEVRPKLANFLATHGFNLIELHEEKSDLEDMFLSITGGGKS